MNNTIIKFKPIVITIAMCALAIFTCSCNKQEQHKSSNSEEENRASHTAKIDQNSGKMLRSLLAIEPEPNVISDISKANIQQEPKDRYQITDWEERFNLPDIAQEEIREESSIGISNNIIDQIAALNEPEIAGKTISLNFEDVDIRTVIKTISDITGINFIIDDEVKGPVTVICPGEIKVGELFEFLESVLDVQGYTAVPTGNHVKIINKKNASGYNLSIHNGADPDNIEISDRIITQMMPLKYADATDAATLIKPLLGSGNALSVYKKSNTIILTDTSATIHHIAQIIRQIDIPGARKEFSRIPLRYASAETLSKQITDMMNQNPLSPDSGTYAGSGNVQIQADSRTNSLLIIAGRRDMEIIFDMIRKLDVVHSADNSNIHVIPLLNAEAKTVAEALQNLDIARLTNTSGTNIRITPFTDTNSLIITAATPDYMLIETIVKQLDITQEQISIDLLIVEVSEGDLQKLGIDWATMDSAVSDSMRYFGATNFGVRVDAASGDYEGMSLGAFRNIDGTTKVGAVLNALKRITSANVISSPNVVTSNHKEALFQAGDNIPYLKDSRITENMDSDSTLIKTYDYKDVGVDLKITPHINQGELIRLVINSEFTQQKDSLTGLGAETPTLSKRKITTEITMVDGASIVIGGLIRDENNETVNGIPFLSDIPLIGELFKTRTNTKQKSNLLLFITPKIIRTSTDAAAISRDRIDSITRPAESK